MRILVLWCVALLLPGVASAQGLPRPHAELPSAEQPARNVPTTGYTLSLSWTPEYCHGARGERAADPECRAAVQRQGFILHGLWPDGDGPDRWPQYCHPVAILGEAALRAGIAATPSPQLLQHEWAKHGSCMGNDPVAYFTEESRLYRGLAMPDMGALGRRRDLTAGDVQQAFAAANPKLPAQAVRVHANRNGWLDEIWLCLGKTRQYQPCGADQDGGLARDARVKIEAASARRR